MIATFGDELLCLPEVHSQDNGALMWSIDPAHLPKKGTPVTLRLLLKKIPSPSPSPIPNHDIKALTEEPKLISLKDFIANAKKNNPEKDNSNE